KAVADSLTKLPVSFQISALHKQRGEFVISFMVIGLQFNRPGNGLLSFMPPARACQKVAECAQQAGTFVLSSVGGAQRLVEEFFGFCIILFSEKYLDEDI